MGAAMPAEDLDRPAPAPAPIDHTVDLLHVETAHLGGPSLATDHAGGVLLPVDDVREGVLHRPRVPGRGPGDATRPVGGTEPGHEAVQLGELASRPGDDLFSNVAH